MRPTHVLMMFATVAATVLAFSLTRDSDVTFVHDSPVLPSPVILDPFDHIVLQGTQFAWNRKYYEEGADMPMPCLELASGHVILDPETEPDRLAELMNRLGRKYSESNKVNYRIWGRWTETATDGSTGVEGDPITLLWGFMPDGVYIDSDMEIMEPGGPNIINAVFDTTFGNPNQWKIKMRNAMARWEVILGTTYFEVAYDDSAAFPGTPGQVGVRPDIRIGGRSIDGSSGILAYNNFPFNGGDMVMDTDDAATFTNPGNNFTFLRNVTMHEHGHGMGLGHVTPIDNTKLMEATAGLAGLGPFDDDIRGAQLLYGDFYENNDTPGAAYDLGAIVDTLLVGDLSIDHGVDDDYYRVTIAAPQVAVTATPIGSTYPLGIQFGPPPTPISTHLISDPDLELYDSSGTTLIAASTSGGLGDAEVLGPLWLPYQGDYVVRVFRKTGTGDDVQRYELDIDARVATAVAVADRLPESQLGLTVTPNPFNPKTTIRFHLDAAATYELSVHDIAGRLIRSIQASAAAGEVAVIWDGHDDQGRESPSGVYFVSVNAGSRDTRRVVLMR